MRTAYDQFYFIFLFFLLRAVFVFSSCDIEGHQNSPLLDMITFTTNKNSIDLDHAEYELIYWFANYFCSIPSFTTKRFTVYCALLFSKNKSNHTIIMHATYKKHHHYIEKQSIDRQKLVEFWSNCTQARCRACHMTLRGECKTIVICNCWENLYSPRFNTLRWTISFILFHQCRGHIRRY